MGGDLGTPRVPIGPKGIIVESPGRSIVDRTKFEAYEKACDVLAAARARALEAMEAEFKAHVAAVQANDAIGPAQAAMEAARAAAELVFNK